MCSRGHSSGASKAKKIALQLQQQLQQPAPCWLLCSDLLHGYYQSDKGGAGKAMRCEEQLGERGRLLLLLQLCG